MNMVSEIKKRKIPLYLQEIEARELGRLIEEDEIAEIEEGRLGNRIKEFLKNNNSNEKVVGSLLLVFIAVLSLVVWLTFLDDDSRVNLVETRNGLAGKSNPGGIKPIVFKLQSFFMPLRKRGKETGQFLTLKAELILSNKIVLREVEQALPLIRQNIFSLLKRTNVNEFVERKKHVEAEIKKEIISTTNTVLISGVGSVEDVFFSQFIIN